MAFLRRLFGAAEPATQQESEPEPTSEPTDVPEDEEARDRELLRTEAERLDDELIQRQIRYADRSWVPPRQGGELRCEDGDRGADEG